MFCVLSVLLLGVVKGAAHKWGVQAAEQRKLEQWVPRDWVGRQVARLFGGQA